MRKLLHRAALAIRHRIRAAERRADRPLRRPGHREKAVRLARERDEVLARVSFGAG